MDATKLARALGWFSLGLGLTEAVFPKALGRAIGMRRHPRLLRLYGLREITAGIGVLASGRPGPWMWARVAGDALDLTALGSGLGPSNARRERTALATAAVAGVTALDIFCALKLSQAGD
jgi:hypothetical protein